MNKSEGSGKPTANVEPLEAKTKPPLGLFGRWKGPRTCLELYPSGEFEISVMGMGPKYVLMGEVTQRRVDATTIELTLRPTRIRNTHWVGTCRKRVWSAKLHDSYPVLGTELSTSASSTLVLRTLAEHTIELCGERCEKLAAEAPRLLGKWRKAGLIVPSQPKVEWKVGEPLELEVKERRASIRIGADADVTYDVYGDVEIKPLGPGLFRVVVTPTRINKGGDFGTFDRKTTLFGAVVAVGSATRFSVERVKGGIEVCAGRGLCTRLVHYDGLR